MEQYLRCRWRWRAHPVSRTRIITRVIVPSIHAGTFTKCVHISTARILTCINALGKQPFLLGIFGIPYAMSRLIKFLNQRAEAEAAANGGVLPG